MKPDHIFISIQSPTALTLGGGRQEMLFVIILQRAHSRAHLFGKLPDCHIFIRYRLIVLHDGYLLCAYYNS